MTLDDIKGIGPKSLIGLNNLGIIDINSLLSFYPYRFDILKRTPISEFNITNKVIIDGKIESIPTVYYFNKRMNKMTFRINTGHNLYNVTIFNRAFMKKVLELGTNIIVIGKYDAKYNTITASDIKLGVLGNIPTIEPIYHTNDKITTKQLRQYINEALISNIPVDDFIPDKLNKKYNLLSKKISLNNIHNPKDIDLLKRSINTLKYEEAFLFMLKMYLLKEGTSKEHLKRSVNYNQVENFISKLPFSLTTDQLNSVDDIYIDLTGNKRMNRLLQGDVGSGKTIVAFIAMYINYLSGYQSAMMAPTEILAIQHYENFKKLFKDYNINVSLLIGKLSLKEKKKIYNDLKLGKIDVVVGTHALISDGVTYNNLGLVITDEQHRFGVHQRSNLRNKGIMPDVLYASATPIPRTYALTLYGDMDISNIKTMPMGRKSVITELYNTKQIREVLMKMYQELKLGHQIYVIAPLIEESDKIDLSNVNLLEEQMNKAFGKLYNIEILHGKMASEEKDSVMESFKENKIQILISTTVIEVGVDVKNATMIVIFDAYRFGLSQLHQLRGRVGRNDLQSYCILISDKEAERLNVLVNTSDGFKISEEDFKLRGSGDIFGTRQSGDMNFKILNVKNDYNVLRHAKEDVLDFISNYQEYDDYDKIMSSVKSINNLD